MRNVLIITIFLAAVTGSCNSGKKKPLTILEEKKIDVSSIYKKRGNDLVEALYAELVNQSAGLKELENQINDLKKHGPESLDGFKKFNAKNISYYGAADQKSTLITDSVLRKKMLALINQSRRNYLDSIAHFTILDSLLKVRSTTLNDLHLVLKLAKTLPLIEEFQKNNEPDSTPAHHSVQRLDALIHKLDSLGRMDSLKNSLKK